jgi:hypothetical protein
MTSPFDLSQSLLYWWSVDIFVCLYQLKSYSTFSFGWKIPFGAKFWGVLGDFELAKFDETAITKSD